MSFSWAVSMQEHDSFVAYLHIYFGHQTMHIEDRPGSTVAKAKILKPHCQFFFLDCGHRTNITTGGSLIKIGSSWIWTNNLFSLHQMPATRSQLLPNLSDYNIQPSPSTKILLLQNDKRRWIRLTPTAGQQPIDPAAGRLQQVLPAGQQVCPPSHSTCPVPQSRSLVELTCAKESLLICIRWWGSLLADRVAI